MARPPAPEKYRAGGRQRQVACCRGPQSFRQHDVTGAVTAGAARTGPGPQDPTGEVLRTRQAPRGRPDDGWMSGRRRFAGRSAVLLALLCAGCASVGLTGITPGPQQTQTRTIASASAVELASSGDLVLTSGGPPSLRITAGRNVLDHLTSDVHGDRLTLGTDGSVHDVGRVRYDLVLPAARVVELSGSGDLHATAPSGLQHVVLSGSGDVRIDGLRTGSLAVDLSGSGQVTVAGAATRQTVSIGGSGDYSAGGLTSQAAEITISGSGDADVAVTGTLTAVISGSGSVTYTGNPAVSSSITGSGSVVRR